VAATARPSRYALSLATGVVATFGGADFEGDATARPGRSPVVALAASRDGRGYWLAERDGVVRSFGDAGPGAGGVAGTTVGIAADPAGAGWWTVSAGGVVRAGGGAPALAGPVGRGAPVTGIAAAAGGRGVWLAHRDGTVSAVGAVPATAPVPRRGPVAAIAGTRDGRGYWTVGPGGTVTAAGDAGHDGSWGRPPGPVTAITASADGRGYLVAAADGAVRAFGDARWAGDARSPLQPPGYPAAFEGPPVRAVGLAALAAGPQPARRGPLRILFLGDSLAALAAKYTGEYLWARHLDATVADGAILGCGVVGALTLSTFSDPAPPAPTLPACAQWYRRDAQAVAAAHPDVVAVLLGYWESQRHGLEDSTVSLTTSAAYRAYVAARLARVAALARDAGAAVVFVEPPDFGDGTPDAEVTTFDALVTRVARAAGARWVDLRPLLDPGGRYRPTVGPLTVRTADRVHLSAAGVEAVVDPTVVPVLLGAGRAARRRAG